MNEEYNRNKYGNLGKLIQDMDWDWYDYLIEYKAAGKWPAPDRWGLKFKLDKRFGIKVTDSIPYTDDEIYCDEYKNNLEIPYNISESGLWTTIHLLDLIDSKLSKHR